MDFTHEQLMKITSETIKELKNNSVLLSLDLPEDVTLEELNSQIAVQHGQSMTIYVLKDDNQEIPVVVNQKNSKVIDLKRSIQRQFTMHLKRSGVKKKVSWRHVWRNNCLSYDNTKLKNDFTPLAELGIKNKSFVRFAKRLNEKGRPFE